VIASGARLSHASEISPEIVLIEPIFYDGKFENVTCGVK